MLKTIYIYFAALLVTLSACNKDEGGLSASGGSQGEGFISLKVKGLTDSMSDALLSSTDDGESFAQTASKDTKVEAAEGSSMTQEEVDALLNISKLRIYNADKSELYRRYEPLSNMPDKINMMAGDYLAKLEIGEPIPFTKDKAECFYSCETPFEIVAAQTKEITLSAKLQNILVEVEFDESLDENLVDDYELRIVNADSYSDEAFDASTTKTTFAREDEGRLYFLIDEDSASKNIAWKFIARTNTTNDVVEKSGVILKPSAATLTKLRFSYDLEIEVSKISLIVDTSTEDFYNSIEFILQPDFQPQGFDDTKAQFVREGESFVYEVSSLSELKNLSVTLGTKSYTLLDNKVVQTVSDDIKYEIVDTKNGLLTISATFFDGLQGGLNTLSMACRDVNNALGVGELTVRVGGISTLINTDYWLCTAEFGAQFVDFEGKTIELQYRTKEKTASDWSEWLSCSATNDGEGYFNATIAPKLIQNSLGNGSSQMLGGLRSEFDYEFRALADGELQYDSSETTPQMGGQIPYSDMENGDLSCWTTTNTFSTTWASGNNSYTEYLAQHSTKSGMGGSYCAYLAAAKAPIVNVLAAGNLIYGRFEMETSEGSVKFGQQFDWNARPREFQFKYAAAIGKVDKDGQGLNNGDSDIARVYVAIVDWSNRHTVTSGTSNPEGVWDPETEKETGEGRIIGYASIRFDDNDNISTMQTVSTPFFYYDTEGASPKGPYTIAISASTCAFGDYLVGSYSSQLWLDDFKLVY